MEASPARSPAANRPLAGGIGAIMNRRRGTKIGVGAALLGAGVAVGWLTAPRRGSFFRARLSQKAARWSRAALRYVGKRRRDLRNRWQGATAEARKVVQPGVTPDDATLAARVRSQLGRRFALGQVEVTAKEGVVTLSGQAAGARERERIIAAVRRVEGVRAVHAQELRAAA